MWTSKEPLQHSNLNSAYVNICCIVVMILPASINIKIFISQTQPLINKPRTLRFILIYVLFLCLQCSLLSLWKIPWQSRSRNSEPSYSQEIFKSFRNLLNITKDVLRTRNQSTMLSNRVIDYVTEKWQTTSTVTNQSRAQFWWMPTEFQ